MKSVECHLHALMCSVSVVTVVFIHTIEDDQRLNTLVHEGDTLHFSFQHCKKCYKKLHVFSIAVYMQVMLHVCVALQGTDRSL